MTSTAATGISHDQQPRRRDMDEHQHDEHLRTACPAADQERHQASRYPAQVGSIWPHLLADGYTITWAPAPAGCSLTLDRRGPRGEHAAYRGGGPTMQHAWDEVWAQLGHGEPRPAGTREAPGSARGSDRLYRVVQYYDSWPFRNDSRVPRGSKSRRRTDTFRTLGPVRQRLARANGLARYQRRNGGDWSAFIAIAEQLTDDGWQPIDVDLQEYPAGGDGTELDDPLTVRAGQLGRDAGHAAATWVFDGNTPDEAHRHVLRGIEDGDPAVLDLVEPPALGPGAGYDQNDLAGDLGLDPGDPALPRAASAYADAFTGSFWAETERAAREHTS
jgi:hypothetical protein